MTNEQRWDAFIVELRAYIEEHHHLPDKHKVEHRAILNKCKYIRRKIKDGSLEESKVQEFNEALALRSTEHTGGRRKKTDN